MTFRIIVFALIIGAVHACGGCAIAPNYVAPEIEHMSHATQHEPLTNHPTNYGSDIASVVVHWDLPKRFSLELAEGVALDKHYPQVPAYGELIGPREQFSARIQYHIQVKP